MNNYVVLYRDNSLSVVDAPYGFVCSADDTDHAEEQCENAYPDCEVVWVFEGSDVSAAKADYWDVLDSCGE